MHFYETPTDNSSPCLHFAACGKITPNTDNSYILPPDKYYCLIFTGYCHLTVTDREGERTFGKMTLFFSDMTQEYKLKADKPSGEIYIFFLSGTGCEYFVNTFRSTSPDGFSLLSPPDMLLRFEDLVAQYDAYSKNSLRELQFFTNLLSDIISSAGKPENINIPKYLESIKELFDNEYQRSYTLDMLERRFHVNKYKISKDFTRFYGMSPISYLNKSRIEHAKHLLLSTGEHIDEIGFKVGIETTNHFIRLFKKYTSTTPAAYRKLSRGRNI